MTKFFKIRKTLPQSNAKLAKIFGVSERTIRRWIKGDSKPKEHVMIALRGLAKEPA